MTTKDFIAYYERAYDVRLNTPQLLASASFMQGYAMAAKDLGEAGGNRLATCSEDFMVAVRMLTALQQDSIQGKP